MPATKTFVECYRCYNIYEFKINSGDVFYNGISDYVRDGFVTISGSTKEEVIQGINNVYKRMQLISLYKRTRGK